MNRKIQELRQLNNLRELIKKKLKDFKVSRAAYTESSSLDILKQIRESLEQYMKEIKGKMYNEKRTMHIGECTLNLPML